MISVDTLRLLLAHVETLTLAVGSPTFEQDAQAWAKAKRELLEQLEREAAPT